MRSLFYLIVFVCAAGVHAGGANCPDGKEEVQCFANPCEVNSCPEYPNATCTANYCGGCNADYMYLNRMLTSEECAGDSGATIMTSLTYVTALALVLSKLL